MTEAEKFLWRRLRRKQIGKAQFYRQKVIGNYIVDFFCAQAGLVIELDGGQHYSEEGRAKDEKRDRDLKNQGLQILRFLAERNEREKTSGQKARGQDPEPPTPQGPQAKDQVNLTDAESRIMPVSGGGFEQAFNAQAGVDMKSMLIVTNHVTQATNDKEQIEPALAQLADLPKQLGKAKAMVADNGFFSRDNVEMCEAKGLAPYIANGRDHHHPSLEGRFSGPPPLPASADAVAKMSRRLQTSSGRKIYARRKSTVEPVFGSIKAVMGFRQFLLRGLQAAEGEWTLVCMAWNFKRMHGLKLIMA